jgi:hypothetical protein
MVTDVECRAMAYVISRTVAPELQPAVLVLAAVPGPWGLRALPWTGMLGHPVGEIVDLLAEFYAERGEDGDRAREQARRTWALYG